MTHHIEKIDTKDQTKREKPLRKGSTKPNQPHTQPGANEPAEVRLPTRVFFGDQGDFEDGTI